MADGNAARLQSISAADRVPPHNLEAEQSLLGSMFLSMEAIEAVLMEVRAEDFYRLSHSKIYEAIRYLYERGERADVITVADRLEATGELEHVGGKPYLLTVVNTVPTAANVRQYADIVRRLSTLRELIRAGTKIVGMSYDRQDEPDEVVQEAEKLVFDVANKRMRGDFKLLHGLLKEGFKHLEALYESQDHVTGVTTGYPELDHILAGLHRGDLVILAARPSVGKTALALNMAVNAAKKQVPVAVFSLEMSSEQLVQRILCAEAEIDSHKMQTGSLTDLDWREINYALGRLDKCELWVDDTPSASILEIRSKARRLFSSKTSGLIIVDYLQLMQPQNRRSESRQVEIAEISRGLKILAKELKVPVIALSQLSREVEKRASKRPMLSDLRESGAIEQDADVVIFIDRVVDQKAVDDEEGKRRPNKGEAEIIVAKHRNGPLGQCTLAYKERFTKFVTMATYQD